MREQRGLSKVVVLALVLGGTMGCSGDLAGLGMNGTADDGTGTGDLGETEGPGADTTAGPPGEDDGTGEADPTSCDVDCGEGGYCELDEVGSPQCLCDEGYAAFGLRCLPCVPTNGDVSIDVPSVLVTSTFTLNGEPFTSSIYENGDIVLRDPASGDEVRLGNTQDGGTDDAIAMVPGTYEVHYANRAGGQLVPANDGARIDTVEIPDSEQYTLSVDVPGVEVSGELTFDGQTPPNSIYEHGVVVLRDPATGDEVELGDTMDGEYVAMVVPGVYDVHYRVRASEGHAPSNNDARFATVEITEPEDTLDIDIPNAMVAASILVDGDTPPDSIYENGYIILHDLQTDDEFIVGQTRDASFAVPVIEGQYEVIYRRVVGGSQVPVNTRAVLDQVDVPWGGLALSIDVTTAVITGAITINGAPPPTDPGDDGVLLLRNPESGDEAVLGNTHDGAYSQRVVLGAYDVYYRQETSSGGVPANTNARLQPIVVRGGASFDVDIPMVTVDATVTVDGQLPPDSAYDDGLVYLRDTQTGDSVLLGNTRLVDLQRPVIPGTYDLVYVVEAAGPTVPVNADARLSTVDVGQGTALEVDIPVHALTGPITVGGNAPPASIYDRGVLLLHDATTEDLIYLGPLGSGAFSRTVTGGSYVVAYRALASNGLVPANSNAGLACFELTQ
ncbi:MAG: hypothetical protein K0V04_40265 [Deltaproteobacteria bacterium]|nr:hypothetical protein [Deltaproteobacteria bacterium]